MQQLQLTGEPYTAGEAWTAATEPATLLRQSAAALRAVIEDNAPIDLGRDAGLEHGGDPTC